MFELTATSIDTVALAARLAAPEAGAAVIFEGRVRNHHLGLPVTKLEYEAFDEMAQREGDEIVSETERLYPGTHVICVHRTGTLQIGEVAVWIGVASAHRQAGYAASRHVIEELKRRLPIWKKEHHPDGASEWVNCTAEARTLGAAEARALVAAEARALVATEAAARSKADDYYARQSSLPEVGEAGQARLAAARVLVVGIGGLGCPAALYLAGAGVGRLTLVDGGRVELSNLHRQILFTTAEVGVPKTLAAAARLRSHNPSIEIVAHEGELTATNARALVAGQSVVLDCTDNFATRFVLHDACLALGVPLVSAAVHRFEGTLDVFQRGVGGCLHCLWLGRSPGELDTAGNCAGGPVFGPAVGVLGVMQAAEAIKLVLGHAGEATRQTRLVNVLDGSQLVVERPANPACPVCTRLEQLKAMKPARSDDPSLFLHTAEIAVLGPTAQTVYLPEPDETAPPAMIVVPPSDLMRLRELASIGTLVLTCRYGVRSAALARLLRAEGLTNVFAQIA